MGCVLFVGLCGWCVCCCVLGGLCGCVLVLVCFSFCFFGLLLFGGLGCWGVRVLGC